VFTKEIQRALLAGAIHLAVHSLKDLPTEPVDGLMLAAVPPRESVADVLVLPAGSRGQEAGNAERQSLPLSMLRHGARVGTGSLRRQAQLRHVRPDLQMMDIRGNVDTRLRKLDAGQVDAVVLAEAGLVRLGLAGRITEALPSEVMLPAVGQGALAIECRADDAATQRVVAALDDAATHAAVLAERALLAHLRGGCMAPVGARAWVDRNELQLSAVVLSSDGARRLAARDSAATTDRNSAEELGRRVAERLLADGAAELISAARSN
jgi:hydroxymethylbilane synthase